MIRACESFSKGTDNVLKLLRPYGGAHGTASFPRGLDRTAARRGPNEDLQTWFRRCVDQCCCGQPERCKVEENLVLLAMIGWRDHTQLTYASLQALVLDCTVEDFYLGHAAEANYVRLDLDYDTLGDPFTHPLAHIHCGFHDVPRFALEGSTNVVMDFLEFLYRQFYPRDWLTWAEFEWNAEFEKAGQEESVNPFRVIVEAFRSNQIQILRDHASDLERLKRVLRTKKAQLFQRPMANGVDQSLLAYP